MAFGGTRWTVFPSYSLVRSFDDEVEARTYYDACVNDSWNSFVYLTCSETIEEYKKEK